MVTPQIRFAPETAVRPFCTDNGRLDLSLDLQIPVAACGEKKGSLAYVNPVLLLVDPQRGVKISFVVGLFSRRSTGGPQKVIQHIAHDGPTKSWMIQCKLREQQPETNYSLDPADFQLSSFHLNAELTFETAPAELGWSMRRALLTLEE
ncbi:MAG: hypothetical protein NTY19_05755 [Planctomycetota bacterium]|nr:hypothetical protein [Planctomycetota bacterium]